MSDDPRVRAIERAVHVYGETPTISRAQRTVTTLQGRTETGFVVGGRAHGGDYVGCVYSTRGLAQEAIDEAVKQ